MSQKTAGNLRQEQAAATMRKLLESAQRLFAEKGYEGTSVRMINRSVNLADGLLYHYFQGGKKEIFETVIRENIKQIMDALDAREKMEEYVNMPMEQVLEYTYCNFMQVIDKYLDFIRMMFRENEVREFITKEEMRRFSGNRYPWLPPLLCHKIEAGEIRHMDFEMAAMMVNSVLMNYVLAKVVGIDHNKLEDTKWRKRLIDYQVSIWMEPKSKD